MGDPALNSLPDGRRGSIREHCRHRTDESGGPFLIRHALQTVEEYAVFHIIGGILPCKPGGIDSRRLVQIINLKPGIIGKHDIACQDSGHGSCLDLRVLLKAHSVFHDLHIHSRFFHGKDLHPQISQDHADLFHFIFISCGKYNSSFHFSVPSVFFCLGGLGPENW